MKHWFLLLALGMCGAGTFIGGTQGAIFSGCWAADCNSNGVEDTEDIAGGLSADCNEDGIPDACEVVPVTFELGEQRIELPPVPRALEKFDLDGDGAVEIVAVGEGAGVGTVTVILNRGERQFQSATLDAEGAISAVTCGDVDQDGFLDVVTANHPTRPADIARGEFFLIFRNLGDGKLAPGSRVDFPFSTRSVTVADLDGDGRLDLAAPNRETGGISILRGRGDGTFQEPLVVTAAQEPRSIVSADLDGDGGFDLATFDGSTSALAVVLTDGRGGFEPPISYSLDDRFPSLLRASDLNGDGAPDLIGSTAREVVVLLNRGDGTFVEATNYPVLGGRSFAVGDVDGNVTRDLAVVVQPNAVVLKRNDGSGRFHISEEVRGLIQAPSALAVQDFDRDGFSDIAVLSTSPSALQVLWGEPDAIRVEMHRRTVRLSDPSCNGIRCRPHAAAVADVDGDSDLDAVAFVPWPAVLITALNESGTLIPQPAEVFAQGQPRSAAAADLDGDGKVDLAVGIRSEDVVAILRGRGDGTFTTSRFLAASTPLRVRLADFDGDGSLDIVTAGLFVSVWLNRGDLEFSKHPDQNFRVLVIVGSEAVTPLDADGDGTQDLAIGHRGATNLSTLLNGGDGTFAEVFEEHPLAGRPTDLRSADFNGDGRADIVAADSTPSVSLLLNGGGGRFEPARAYKSGAPALSLIVEDVDSNGHLDVVTASEVGSTVSVLSGRGDGGLGAPESFPTGSGLRFVRSGDFDLDGDPDLVTFDRSGNSLTILYNETPRRSELPSSSERICTDAEFHSLGRITGPAPLQRALPFLLRADDAVTFPPIQFVNGRRFATAAEFLEAEFPDVFGDLTRKEYHDLVATRGTGSFFAGEIVRLAAKSGVQYGFTLEAAWDNRERRPTVDEVQAVHDQLVVHHQLAPFAYSPLEADAQEAAASWENPEFPVYIAKLPPSDGYIAYTQGVAFGRVRILSPDGRADAAAACSLNREDIVILKGTPRALDAVASAVITTQPQDEEGLLAVRTGRRGTPNLYAGDALEGLTPFAGQLIRLEADRMGYSVRAATRAEAEAFWREKRQELLPPLPDPDFIDLLTLEEIVALDEAAVENTADSLVARFGGHTARLSRLHPLLSAEPGGANETGFTVPAAHFLSFLRSNRLPSAVDGTRLVTYDEYLGELRASPELIANPEGRCEALRVLREAIRTKGQVPAELVRRIGERGRELFGERLAGEGVGEGTNLGWRFLPSPGFDAPLAFSNAGLYAAAQVEDRGDDEGADIAVALREVWAGAFSLAAAAEKRFFDVPFERVAMSVLVVGDAAGTRASGIVRTGNPRNSLDRRLIVRSQIGSESVLGKRFGVQPETVRLSLAGTSVAEIRRDSSSSLVRTGTPVLDGDALRELGSLVARIDRDFPVNTGDAARDDVRLEVGFRQEPSGGFVITSVTPFLITDPPLPVPSFELEVPAGTVICGVFSEAGAGRGLREEYELYSEVDLRTGVYPLPTTGESFGVDLIDGVRFGPTRETGSPLEPGRFERFSFLSPAGAATHRFTYRQLFVLESGRQLEIAMVAPLTFTVEEGVSDGTRRVLDEEFFTTKVGQEAFEGRLDDQPLIHYGSCTHRSLDRFRMSAVFEDGSQIELVERFREEDNLFETGPASLQQAVVAFPGARQVISNRSQLVYSAVRHNAAARYWVVLDTPVTLPYLARPIAVVEFAAPAPDFGRDAPEAFFLDANFEVFQRYAVVTYARELIAAPELPTFRRGDVHQDGSLNVTDALTLLRFLFQNGATPQCHKAGDTNDDGQLNLADAIIIAQRLFGRLGPLPPPAGECGADPTDDGLECREGCP